MTIMMKSIKFGTSSAPGRSGVRNRFAALSLAACVLAIPELALAKALTAIEHAGLPGNKVAVTLKLDSPAGEPQVFTITDPARLAIDLPGTDLQLPDRSVNIGVGAVEGVSAVEAGGRTRVVLNLSEIVPYEMETSGNTIRLIIASPEGGSSAQAAARAAGGNFGISEVDFRRSADGAGRVIISLADPSTPIDVREEGGKVVADFLNTRVPAELERRLDVTDFATPVQTIDVRRRGNNVRMTITPSGEYDHIAYQSGGEFTIELKPVTKEELEARRALEGHYTGERLSLNFQDIEVRSVLQLIADFTGLNVVVSDSVSGNITLRLQDVPWDQALDIILKTKGLDKRQQGNVLLIAPAAEIAERERIELESQQQVAELAPLRSEFMQVNYAKASDLAQLIAGGGSSLLSERGTVKIDERTNTLIVQDTERNLADIRSLIHRLDIPVRQVLIESRIVLASNDFSKDLGVRFGISGTDVDGRRFVNAGGTNSGYVEYGDSDNPQFPGIGTGFVNDDDTAGLITDLAVLNPAGALSLAVGKVGTYLLQLELSAMETEGQGTVVSSPRVITANQKSATIEQGVEIPYEEASSSGATSVSFKKAVLGLTVTPQITPDDRVLLDLEVSKDSRGEDTSAGPAINTQSVNTQVLVNNGETVVLGGIYERTNTNGVRRVPLFGELPLIGHLFKSTTKVDARSELLVFVTPKILKDSLAIQ